MLINMMNLYNLLAIIGTTTLLVATTTIATTTTSASLIGGGIAQEEQQNDLNNFVLDPPTIVTPNSILEWQEQDAEQDRVDHKVLRGAPNHQDPVDAAVAATAFKQHLKDLEAAFQRDLQSCQPIGGDCRYDSACCGADTECYLKATGGGAGRIGTCRERGGRVGRVRVNNDNDRYDGRDNGRDNGGIFNRNNCRSRGDQCTNSNQCCSGMGCKNGECANLVGANQCGELFDSCQVDGDCCAGLVCPGNECLVGANQCGELFDSCQVDGDCCSDLVCDGFECVFLDDQCGELFDSCQVDDDCCAGLVCPVNECISPGGGGGCGIEGDSCQVDVDCCAGLVCDGIECIFPGGGGGCGIEGDSCVFDEDCCFDLGLTCPDFVCERRCGLTGDSCLEDFDCCSFSCNNFECTADIIGGGTDCVLAGEFCRSDSDCCTDPIDFLVCSNAVCRPFTTNANACVGREGFCINSFDCCGAFTDGGLYCANDNSCQRFPADGCSSFAGTHCKTNDDCCGPYLQCAPNERCTRIYTGPGYRGFN